ncbi:hypothetical protein HDV00_000297 [Rhizophlyctis rosea]|nr:hypothetical protein HDV00_000297 [Rhizophlyctis rosea]
MRYIVMSNFVEPPVFRSSSQNRLPLANQLGSSLPLARRSRSRVILLIVVACLGYWFFLSGDSKPATDLPAAHFSDPQPQAKADSPKFGYKNVPAAEVVGKPPQKAVEDSKPPVKAQIPKAPQVVEKVPAATPAPKPVSPAVIKKPAVPAAAAVDAQKPIVREEVFVAATILPGPTGIAQATKPPHLQPKVTNAAAGFGKATVVASQTLPYYGSVPTALTGTARKTAFQLAAQAKKAELEAAEALGRAEAAKALVMIAAETNLNKLVKKYWKSATKAYNATVQATAAKRIRQFLVPANTPTKTPICLVAYHQGHGEAFPPHITAFLDSVARNDGYANVHLFVHNVTTESIPDYQKNDNVRVVDISMVDRSYKIRGFAGMATDALCSVFGKGDLKDPVMGWRNENADCALLEERLSQYKGDGGHFMTQLQGHFANIFAPWVGPNVCESWAWANTDTIVGNMSRWLKNKKVEGADLATTHEGDAWRVYLRHTFTIHNWRNNPTVVEGLWKRCEALSTLEGILDTFKDPSAYLSITEGCYSNGALTTPGINAVLLPWQLPPWRKPTLVVLYEGHLAYCVGETYAENCRKWVKGIVKERAAREKQAAALKTTGKTEAHEFHLPNGPSIAEAFSKKPRAEVSMPLKLSLECSNWIPSDKQICLGDKPTDLPEMDWEKHAYIQSVSVPAGVDPAKAVEKMVVKMEEYELPRDFVSTGTERGVAEILIVPSFVEWASTTSGKPPKVEKTWFYTVDKGSIQVSPGKVLLHTLGGWW